MDTSCYENAVGLARCACPCLEDEAPEGFNDSASGLFIADLAPLDALEGLDDCSSPGNPWEVLSNARTQAILAFMADVSALMLQRNKLARKPFRDGIGQGYARETVLPPGAYAGLRIRCAPIRHGKIVIEKIGGIFNQSGVTEVRIFDRFNEQVGDVHTINAVGGKLTELDVNVSLPMYTPWAEAQEYFLVYEVNPANKPRNNQIHCGCGGTPDFHVSQPFRALQTKYNWANWVKVGGWAGDALDAFDEAAEKKTAGKALYGLTVRVNLTCDAARSLCDGDTLDFAQPLSAAIAHAIRYKAAEIVAGSILADTHLHRQSIVNRETLADERKRWEAQYAAQIAYIAEHADVSAGGCLECKAPLKLTNAAVLS